MRGLLSDINIQGHMFSLGHVLGSPYWRELWQSLDLAFYTFPDVGLEENESDAVVWELCQREELILLTANRNQDGPDSLETTLRTRNGPHALPVFTVSNAQRLLASRDYTERVVERLIDYLMDIDKYRGTGRLYLP